MTPIQQIKETLSLAELIGETLTVTGRGKVLSTTEHDSLKIWTDSDTWYWYSRSIGGDILDWYQQRESCDFQEALRELAGRAGVELKALTQEERRELDAQRADQAARCQIYQIAADHYRNLLCNHPASAAARTYLHGRAWTDETIEREQIGYSGPSAHNANDQAKPLSAQLRQAGHADHPLARAVLSIPPDHIVYVHRDRGRITYLSARSIQGKRHYNLPEQIEIENNLYVMAAGPKQIYVNNPVTPVTTDAHLLVEGQADAIALGQLGIRATALCGLTADHVPGITHIAFDNDAAGQAKAIDAALAIDPMAKVLVIPDDIGDIKDPADFVERGNTGIGPYLAQAQTAIWHLARRTGQTAGESRTEQIALFFSVYDQLDELLATDLKPDLAAQLCGGISQFNRLHKAHKAQQPDDDGTKRYEYSAGMAKGGVVFEQCVVDGRASYAVRNADGKIELKPMVDIGSITYVPYKADTGLIEYDVVLFPEKPEPYGSQRQLIEKIREFIHHYLDIDPFYERLAAYYVLFTWVYDLFENLPYLRALGDYGTGKTRFLQAIGALCYRPMFVSGASTVSPIFRLIDMFRGTLIIDEADFGNSDAEAEIIKIMNVGYYRNGVVLRSEKDPAAGDDKYFPSVNRVFGPKIMATRRTFTDRATESRCLTKRMTTARPRPGIPYTLGSEFWNDATRLRNQLLQFRLENHRPIELDQSLADESVEPRLNQVTMAIKSMVDDPTMRQEIDSFIRAYNETLISDRQMTIPAIIVQTLADLHFDKSTNLMGERISDFTMGGIAEKAQIHANYLDPEIRISAKRVGVVLSGDLGLTRRGKKHSKKRGITVEYEESELLALMKRYGITYEADDDEQSCGDN